MGRTRLYMMSGTYDDAERRVLAALLLDWHRDADRLLGTDELREFYSLKIDRKQFEAIVANLKGRGIVFAFYDQEGPAATLNPSAYKEAQSIVFRNIGDPATFAVDWKKEEIVSEVAAPDWFPVPDGWKWLQIASGNPHLPTDASTKSSVQHEPTNWQKWGVIVAAITALITLAVAFV